MLAQRRGNETADGHVIAEQKIAEIRQSARISEFIPPYVSLKRRGRGAAGALSVPRREVAVVLGRRRTRLLPLLRLRRRRQRLQVRDADGERLVSRSGAERWRRTTASTFPTKAARRAPRPSATRLRDARFGGAASTAAVLGRDRLRRDRCRAYLDERGIGEEVARALLSRCGAACRGDALAQHLAREAPDLRMAAAHRPGRSARRLGLRPLPRPPDVPDPRSPGPHARLRRAPHRRGRRSEVPQLERLAVYHKGRVLYGLYEARERRRRAARRGAPCGAVRAAPQVDANSCSSRAIST